MYPFELILLFIGIGLAGSAGGFAYLRRNKPALSRSRPRRRFLVVFGLAYLLPGGLFGYFGFVTGRWAGAALGMLLATLIAAIFALTIHDIQESRDKG